MNKMKSTDNTLSKTERKHKKIRSLIIAAARKLFESTPYEEVSMENIADEVAMSKQTLYNYFSNKESIYFGIGIEDFEQTYKRAQKIRTMYKTGREQVLKLCEGLFYALINFDLNNQIYRRFLITNNQLGGLADEMVLERKKGEPEKIDKRKSFEDTLADYLENIWKYEEYWKAAIKQGLDDGTIKTKLDENQLTYYIFVLISGVVDHIQLLKIPLERSKLDVERIKEVTLGLINNLLEK
ncbi:MAG: TetR/AcrR family transcriptional regulator [Asgard group archaeon]|nr:TetR/AcrR family transcriptional regulator [Asgard group archaeon]